MSRVERHAAEEAALRKDNTAGTEAVTARPAGNKKRRKKKLTPLGRLLDILGTLIMAAAVILCLVLAVPRFAGVQTYIVVSGSMEPAIPVGSLVYSRETEPQTLEPGDVIVFYSTDAAESSGGSADGSAVPITHRVVENHTDEGEIITKGDANAANDLFPTAYANVEGKVVLHIPKLGFLAAPVATMGGKIAVMMVIVAGYLLTEAGSRMKK